MFARKFAVFVLSVYIAEQVLRSTGSVKHRQHQAVQYFGQRTNRDNQGAWFTLPACDHSGLDRTVLNCKSSTGTEVP